MKKINLDKDKLNLKLFSTKGEALSRLEAFLGLRL